MQRKDGGYTGAAGHEEKGRPQRTLMDAVEELQSGGVTEEDSRDRVRLNQMICCCDP